MTRRHPTEPPRTLLDSEILIPEIFMNRSRKKSSSLIGARFRHVTFSLTGLTSAIELRSTSSTTGAGGNRFFAAPRNNEQCRTIPPIMSIKSADVRLFVKREHRSLQFCALRLTAVSRRTPPGSRTQLTLSVEHEEDRGTPRALEDRRCAKDS